MVWCFALATKQKGSEVINMHVAKYTASQIGQMCTHYNRNHGEDRNYSNENIDKEKSVLNYNLAPDRENEVDFINQRINEVKHLNRADVVKMADWVVTLPQDFKGDSRAFFEGAYNALESRYGQENVVSAYVHMDEKQPHLHFAFIPITRTLDKDNNPIEKLSAKEVLTRTELQEMHPYMERVLERKLGHEVHLLNEATRDGNKAIKELKRDTAIKDLERVKDLEMVKDKQIEPVEPRKGLKGLYVPYEQYREDIEKLNSQLYEKQREISSEREKTSHLCNRLDQAERQARGEHELRLKLQDRLDDKDYLKQRVKELEREEHSHNHTHDREIEHSHNSVHGR